jgi:hypothetical protein
VPLVQMQRAVATIGQRGGCGRDALGRRQHLGGGRRWL